MRRIAIALQIAGLLSGSCVTSSTPAGRTEAKPPTRYRLGDYVVYRYRGELTGRAGRWVSLPRISSPDRAVHRQISRRVLARRSLNISTALCSC
jgi:hypothetical protein